MSFFSILIICNSFSQFICHDRFIFLVDDFVSAEPIYQLLKMVQMAPLLGKEVTNHSLFNVEEKTFLTKWL